MLASLDSFVDELGKVAAAAAKSTLTPGSSNVRGFRYDPKAKQLFVTYKSGGTYRYDGVPAAAARALKRNKSAGKTVNRLVKAPGYAYEKVGGAKCKNCGAPATKGLVWAEGRGIAHTCDRCAPAVRKQVGKVDAVRSLEKRANGDMLQYFRDHPDKLKEKQERDRRKKKRGAGSLVRERMREKRAAIEAMGVMLKRAQAVRQQRTFDGICCRLEYLPGDTRSGTNKATGKSWSRKMHDAYGHVAGTFGKGADGEAIDIYLAKDPVEGGKIYKVSQNKKDGSYDEDKYMIGYGSASEAKQAFERHMPDWAFGSMTAMSLNRFRELVGAKA